MAAFFGAVIGFGFDNPRAEPQAVDPMADDFAQQFARNKRWASRSKKASGSIVGIFRGSHQMAEKLQIIATRA
jgi:hypothetical protein